MASLSSAFRQELAIQQALPADLMGALPEDVAVVDLLEVTAYHRPNSGTGAPERVREYEAFVLTKSDAEPGYSVDWVHLGPADEINQAVGLWLGQIEQGQGVATSARHPARALRKRLWETLEPHLNGAAHVVLLPGSQLSFLPFTWRRTDFFADPQFRSALQHDPQSERLFAQPDGDLLSSGRATVTGRNPLILSGVVLAGANQPPVADELGLPTGEDGILTAQEVVSLDLRGAELVTLSACDTGRGTDVAGGEGIYGLQRAFHLAGAQHVVASLWKVDDEATAATMNLLYDQLWRNDEHPAVALRKAQLYLLNHPEEIARLAAAPISERSELTNEAEQPDDAGAEEQAEQAKAPRALKLDQPVPLPAGGNGNSQQPRPSANRTPFGSVAA